MDLTEFLLTRIAEDEAVANHARWAMQDEWFTTAEDKVDEFVRHNSPARVLAECEAKRRIVERLTRAADLAWSGSYAVRDDARASLADLALPYADHPDYRSEWALEGQPGVAE